MTTVPVTPETAVYLALPEALPAPGVLVLHEAYGLNDDIRGIADRFAESGYVAVAPDLTDGRWIRCLVASMRDLQRGTGPTISRVEALLAWLADREDVAGGRVGVAGFCIGGSFALLLGTRGRPRVVAANYGRYPGDELAARLCPTVASYGRRDLVFRSAAAKLENALTIAGVAHDVRLYDGVGHSFMNRHPDHPVLTKLSGPLMAVGYAPAEAEDAWGRIGSFFAEHI